MAGITGGERPHLVADSVFNVRHEWVLRAITKERRTQAVVDLAIATNARRQVKPRRTFLERLLRIGG